MTLESVNASISEIATRIKKGDKDGDGKLSAVEISKLPTYAERQVAKFAQLHASDSVESFDIPTRAPRPPGHNKPFKASGTPAAVAESLVRAHNNPANDNRWPLVQGRMNGLFAGWVK